MNLLNELKTHENIQSFKSSLADLKLSLSGSTKSGVVFIENKFDNLLGDHADILKKYLKEENVSLENISAVSSAIDKLCISLEGEDIIEVSLAFQPSASFIDKLSVWFRDNVSTNAVMKLTVNPELVGGVVLNARGNYVDLSLKKKLDALFKEKGLVTK